MINNPVLENLLGWHLLSIAIYLFLVAIAGYLLYTVIRLAVRKGMRQHQEWLDRRVG
jgi:formate-dependent nitrite reductase membrane component NrfD